MKKNLLIILLLFISIMVVGCKPNRDVINKPNRDVIKRFTLEPTFGGLLTEVTLLAEEEKFSEYADLRLDLSAITNELNALYSTTKNTSYIKKINDKAGIEAVKVTDEVIFILEEAIKTSELSIVGDVALYDITISPIIDLWNINELGYTKELEFAEIPNDEYIQQKLPLIGYNNIVIDKEEKTVFLSKVGMKIDLGSILKGYAADKLARYIKELGFKNGIVNVAGNLLTFGKNTLKETPENWTIGITMPYSGPGDPNRIGNLYFDNITAVSSGIYERYIRTKEGDEYHHIFDPRTGYPIDNELMHVSIFTDLSITGDALSTTIFALGLEAGYEKVESLDGVEALFITKDKEIYITSGLVGNFSFNEEVAEPKYGYSNKGVLDGISN